MNKRGFSLVELSIVLVILGLLVGGVLSGQSLIRAASLRTITTEYNRYVAATLNFKDKYFAYPGDMANATAYWGVAGGTGTDITCNNVYSTDTKTCNGDDNGFIRTSPGVIEEGMRYWQQLANAGMLEGHYTGHYGPGPQYNPTNSPIMKYDGSSIWHITSQSSVSAGDTSNYARPIVMRLFQTVNMASFSFMTPADAWNIDTKMDDGIPNKGKVIAFKGSAAVPCSTTAGMAVAADVNSLYNLTDTAKDCALYYDNVF